MNTPSTPRSLEDRLKKLEAAVAYQNRRTNRIVDALRSAAGHLENLTPGATLAEVIEAVKSAAGHLIGALKTDGRE